MVAVSARILQALTMHHIEQETELLFVQNAKSVSLTDGVLR